jgi:hypothetical protein
MRAIRSIQSVKVVLLIFTTLLTACSGGGTGTNTGGTGPGTGAGNETGSGNNPTIKNLGSLVLTISPIATFPSILGGAFFKLNPNTPPNTNPSLIPINSCKILDTTAASPVGVKNTPLEAGAELTVKKAGVTLGVLKPGAATADIKPYVGDLTGSAKDIADATLEIPGAASGFPAMTATLPPELVSFSFVHSVINKDSTFTWTSPTAGASISFVIMSSKPMPGKAISCNAKDTGSFQFPAAFKTELDAIEFVNGVPGVAIKAIGSYTAKGDSAVIVTYSRTEGVVP